VRFRISIFVEIVQKAFQISMITDNVTKHYVR